MSNAIQTTRRRFFKNMLSGITAIFTFVSIEPLSADSLALRSPGNTEEIPKQGYRETGHIQKYYRKARF